MYQLEETLENQTGRGNLEERIVGLIHTSPHLAALFSEVRDAVHNRTTGAPNNLLCIDCD
jgi:hypothetical protein